ncbi:MAG: hypothetical protein HQL69_03755 [Magnetococcales bacterium]|nr:hypothetical protein [Magnetococcales bacterium]
MADIVAGGLLDLGKMVEKSDYFISVPHIFKPDKHVLTKQKDIGIIIDKSIRLTIEGLRVATGLAGCNHRVTIYYPNELTPFFDDHESAPSQVKPYLETLCQLQVTFSAELPSYDNSRCNFIIGV